jgi:hypothetical protein
VPEEYRLFTDEMYSVERGGTVFTGCWTAISRHFLRFLATPEKLKLNE